MDPEDKRRHLVVCSLFLEIVTPVLREMLKKDYTNCGFGTLQDFLNDESILDKLLYQSHRNSRCRKDKANSRSQNSLQLNCHQRNILYDKKPTGTQISSNCFSQYTSKPVQLEDLDITLSSLLLLTVCNLSTRDIQAVQLLRRYKNDYLSHNIKGMISLREYKLLWDDTAKNILHLDPSRQDEITRLENRPLDLPLSIKYMELVLDNHEKYEELTSALQSMESSVTSNKERQDTLMSKMEAKSQDYVKRQEIPALIKVALEELKCEYGRQIVIPQGSCTQNKLGQDVFSLHKEVKLVNTQFIIAANVITGKVMMDDGRLLICVPWLSRIEIYDTEGIYEDSIHTRGKPYHITAVSSYTVAVVLLSRHENIAIYDIDKKKVKNCKKFSISSILGITTVNNKLVIGDVCSIFIINLETGDMEEVIKACCSPYGLCSNGDKIYYYNKFKRNEIYCYNIATKETSKTTLPDNTDILCITPLKDGSHYLLCENVIYANIRSIIHISSDGKSKTVQSKGPEGYELIKYIATRGKLVTCTSEGIRKILSEQ